MHMFLVVAGAAAAALLVASGVAAITTGWVMPIGRHRILRPRLWGYGCLVCAVGSSLFLFMGPLARAYGLLALTGWFVFMAGLGLQWLAQRPGRDATKTAS
ncbi:hypothetical protein ACFWIO_11540 [Streptomyces diastatochromogenes]|uniref:hypothetical protein n=1 Tax=Streptomyces diastatochromogenes TaxID=42236 RepID=UPI00364920AE